MRLLSISIAILFLLKPCAALPAEPKLRIGLVAGFTGSDPNTAIELEKGMKVFMALHPAAEGALQVERVNNESSPRVTHEVLEKSIAGGIRVFVGLPNSDTALVAAKLAEEKKALLISAFATNPKVTEQRRFTFRVCNSDREQGRMLADFAARDLKARKIAVLTNRDSHYSQGLSEAFIARAHETRGSKPVEVFQDFYTPTNFRLEELAAQIGQKKPQVVFIPDYVTNAAIQAKQLGDRFPKTTFLGGDGWGGQKVLHAILTQDDPKGTPSLFYSTHWNENQTEPVSRKFTEQYRKMYPGSVVSPGAALVYDAFAYLWAGISKSKHPITQSNLDTEALAKTLENTSFESTAGKIRFEPGKDHTPTQRKFVMITVKNGKYELYESKH